MGRAGRDRFSRVGNHVAGWDLGDTDGDPHFAAVALYREGRRAGATADGALAHAYVLPSSLYLWMQNEDFRSAYYQED
jgi:hypothetical protein